MLGRHSVKSTPTYKNVLVSSEMECELMTIEWDLERPKGFRVCLQLASDSCNLLTYSNTQYFQCDLKANKYCAYVVYIFIIQIQIYLKF